jgi:putative protease
MTVTSAAGAEFVERLGCRRAVLARELSFKEIAALRAGLANKSFQLEVFIHGALCVAYSGQCLTSESLGGRSANRGECAQACRLPYELVADEQTVPLGERRYLLSPQDLAGLSVLPDLMRLGVEALKIEGRLKSPEYVANITQIYRQAIDAAAADLQNAEESLSALAAQRRYEMEMAFSRGLSTGWLGGVNHQQLVHGRFAKKRGVYLGTVSQVRGSHVWVKLEAPLKPGDGVVFDASRPDQSEEGGRVYEVDERGAECRIGFRHADINWQRVRPGDRLWKTSDPALERRWRRSYAGSQPRFQRPLEATVSGRVGEPLVLRVTDDQGNTVEVASTMPLVHAEYLPLTPARFLEQFARLGGTPFRLAIINIEVADEVILPLGELNRLRREAVARLEALRAKPKCWVLKAESPLASRQPAPQLGGEAPQVIVLARSLAQLEAALQCGVKRVYCELETPARYKEAVSLVRVAGAAALFVAPPRVTKPGEEWILKRVRACEADGYLVRNYDQLRFFAGCQCVGDYSLNIANPLAAEHFKQHYGLERLTASYDLNNEQLEALLEAAPPEWFEVTLHQHMPLFHMEHCLFCAFLSSGTDCTNCGRPCDQHQLRLRDRVGAEHPVIADASCRNTVFNALAQTGAEYAAGLISLGVRHFRIEFLQETAQEAARAIQMYRRLLGGELTGAQLWRELKLVHQLGVTRGSLDKPDRRRSAVW